MKTCILAIQRYENIKDIYEWVNYHLNLGYDKIFILDNNDEIDPLVIDNKQVDIIPFYGQRNNETDWNWQREAYNIGIDYIKKFNYHWITIIDIDEFVTLYKHTNIKDFIQEECINKGYNSIQFIWELYNDDNKLYHKDEYDGNILNSYLFHFQAESYNANTPDFYRNMRCFTKFTGKITNDLVFTDSAHYPDKKLYDNNIYQWIVCNEEIAVLKHYKYKSLEDFISLKCKQRNYNTSMHGSTWKYARTYFEDNILSQDKIFHFAFFDFKYKLNMIEWDIEYLHELLRRIYKLQENTWCFDIWFGNENNDNTIINNCLNSRSKYLNKFKIFYMNETNLYLDICPYTRFMYDHKLYGICADFFKCLLLYYFGGIYTDRDVEFKKDFYPYWKNNDYILFDSSFHNLGAWFSGDHMICSSFMMSKPFNPIFKYFIDYCNSFSYEQLENMYNTMSKKDFMDYFYDVKIFYYHIIQKHNYFIYCLKSMNDKVEKTDGIIYVFDNYFIEPQKYFYWKNKPLQEEPILIHYNLKMHEQIYL